MFYRSVMTVLFAIATPVLGETLNLETAKRLATGSSLEVLALKELASASKSEVQKTKSNYYPSLETQAGLAKKTQKARDRDWFLSLVAKYNLFRGHRDQAELSKALLEMEDVELTLNRKKLDIEIDVAKLFYNYLLQKNTEAILLQALSINAEHQKLVARAKAAGQLSATDTSEFDLRESILRSDLIEAREQQKLLTNAYRVIANQPERPIEFAEANIHVHLAEDWQALRDKAHANSSSIQASNVYRNKAFADRMIARSGWYPKVDVEAEYGYLLLEEVDESGESLGAEVRLVATWQLFSGGATFHQYRAATYREQAANYSYKFRVTQLDATIRGIIEKLSAIERQHHLAEIRSQKSALYYQAVKKEYLRGYRNSADLSGASENLVQAELKSLQLQINYLLELVELEAMVGKPVKYVAVDKGSAS